MVAWCFFAIFLCLRLAPPSPGFGTLLGQTEKQPKVGQVLDLKKFPGALVEQVVIPVPGEVFSVLDKLGEQDWSSEIATPKRKTSTDRVRLALVFGCTVAEGFVAVEAEDRDAIQDAGRRVLRLADTLGLQDAVLPHSQSIIDSAQSGDWNAVRLGFDQTQATVRVTMEKMRDEEIASLVSLGGWLRGTRALTRLISESYSSDRSELLNQPELAKYFKDAVASMKAEIREQPDVKAIHDGLAEIEKTMEDGKGEISEGAVSGIGEICEKLLKRFYFDGEEQAGS
jgi:hypothetical protein